MAREKLPELQRQEAIKGEVSSAGVGDALRSLAATPTATSEIASSIAQSASNAFSERMGYEMGSNPHGELPPPITKSDEHFVNAYNAQAGMTLSLQSQQMLNANQEIVNKQQEITPESIDSFTKDSINSLNAISQNAPSGVKQKLQMTGAAKIADITHQMNNKLISQQHKRETDLAVVSASQAVESIHGLTLSGNVDAAEQSLEDFKTLNDSNFSQGLISAQQRETYNKTAETAFQKGIYVGQLQKARMAGTEEAYLADFASKGINDIPVGDRANVVKALLQDTNSNASLVAKQDSRIDSGVKLGVTNGILSDEQVRQQASLMSSPTKRNQLITWYDTKIIAQNKETAKRQVLQQNYSSPSNYALLTTKQKNDAFFTQVQSNISNGDAPLEAIVHSVNSAGGAVPAFTAMINNKVASFIPNQLQEAANMVEQVRRTSPNKVILDKATNEKLTAYLGFKQQNNSDEDAAAKAKELTEPQDAETRKFVDNQWIQFSKDHLSTEADAAKFAFEMFGESDNDFANRPFMIQKSIDDMRRNFKVYKGNEDLARKLTKEGFSKTYKFSNQDGVNRLTYSPVAKMVLGDDSGNTGEIVVNHQMTEQVGVQFEAEKKLFDDGRSDWWHEVVDSPDLDRALELRAQVEKLSGEDINPLTPEGRKRNVQLGKLQDELAGIMSVKPVKVLKHFRHAPDQEITLSRRASTNLRLSNVANNPIVGTYEVLGRDEKGLLQPLTIWNDQAGQGLIYRADTDDLHRNYQIMNQQAVLEKKQRIRTAKAIKATGLDKSDPEFSKQKRINEILETLQNRNI